MQTRDLTAAVFAGLAVLTEIQLAVQSPRRLIGDEAERVAGIRHVGWRQPDRMPWAIGIAKAGDRVGRDFDLATGRRQRMRGRVAPEGSDDAAVILLHRQLEFAAL